jgi:mono/diheme cytochrome c family protein
MKQSHQYKEEIDFRDLLKNPWRLFGFGFLYFLGLLMFVGVLYAWNLNAIGKNSVVPLVLTDSSAFVQDIPMQLPSVLPPVDVNAVAHPTPELISRGRELFKGNCASCHGENGSGDGPAGMTLNPKPRNFHQATGWTNGAKVSEIYRTLQEGIIKNGMASFSYLPPVDRFALIHFVRSFHPSPPADADQEIALLETTYQLSKGSVVSAQVPVKEAIKHLVAENRQENDAVASRAASIGRNSAVPGAALFARVVTQPERFLHAFTVKREALASDDEFIRVVTSNPTSLGVRPVVDGFSAQEWTLLRQFVASEVR